MNPTGKKFISLFLVFSLMMLSANLHAKEKRGATLLITKKDGQQIEGELIVVKKDSLLILTKWTGRDVSIDIADVEVIRVVKKSKVLLRASIGFFTVGSLGGLLSLASDDEFPPAIVAFYVGLLYGIPLGALAGAVAGRDKKIKIEGMTDLEIQETLEYLRKKARVRDYK